MNDLVKIKLKMLHGSIREYDESLKDCPFYIIESTNEVVAIGGKLGRLEEISSIKRINGIWLVSYKANKNNHVNVFRKNIVELYNYKGNKIQLDTKEYTTFREMRNLSDMLGILSGKYIRTCFECVDNDNNISDILIDYEYKVRRISHNKNLSTISKSSLYVLNDFIAVEKIGNKKSSLELMQINSDDTVINTLNSRYVIDIDILNEYIIGEIENDEIVSALLVVCGRDRNILIRLPIKGDIQVIEIKGIEIAKVDTYNIINITLKNGKIIMYKMVSNINEQIILREYYNEAEIKKIIAFSTIRGIMFNEYDFIRDEIIYKTLKSNETSNIGSNTIKFGVDTFCSEIDSYCRENGISDDRLSSIENEIKVISDEQYNYCNIHNILGKDNINSEKSKLWLTGEFIGMK